MATQVSLNDGAVASAGALAIQTNGTTQAVSISTGQVATLAQNPILTSGTANGVAYLNGSKVLTTGSALVFDGTNFSTTGTIKGSTTIGVGAATPSASGAGITFPATQSASSDANTLDDYEEGAWTPNIGGTATYGEQAGRYIKVGRLVYAQFSMRLLLIGTGSTTIMSGLPFAVDTALVGGSLAYFSNLAINVVFISPYVNGGATTISFSTLAAAGATAAAGSAVFGNSTDVRGFVLYETP